MIERVLTRCENDDLGELAPLLTLLRRFATEAAREEARMFCDELVADDASRPMRSPRLGRARSTTDERSLTSRHRAQRRRENAFQIIRPDSCFRRAGIRR